MPTEAAISVSELNRRARKLLEQGIARLWVEGELSNLSRPASGHIYFKLKDENAQVDVAWFRQRQRGPALRAIQVFDSGKIKRPFGQVVQLGKCVQLCRAEVDTLCREQAKCLERAPMVGIECSCER